MAVAVQPRPQVVAPPALSEAIVEARGVEKTYDTGKLEVRALRGVTFSVARGEMVAIMGPSGSGKTTLLNCLAGLDAIDAGEVLIDGVALSAMSDEERTDYRARRMGFVFQFYNLMPVLSAVENVELPSCGYGSDVKRHPALVPLSHDHHHALVEARRLRHAAERADNPEAAAAAFADFFAAVSVPHFREEEETLFPLVAADDEARPLVVDALLDHQRLHALVAELPRSADVRALLREIGEVLEAHVRREERELFPLIERLAGDALERDGPPAAGGPVWGEASDELNATLLAWRAGEGPAEHVNEERDVFVFLVDGSALIAVEDELRDLRPGDALIVPKGHRRKITAGRGGVRYLSVHLRRPPLQIESRRKVANAGKAAPQA